MSKKAIVLAIMCSIIVGVVFFEFFVFKTPVQQTNSVAEIVSDPSAWVNRTIVVEGNLSGPIFFMLSESSPWNYELSSDGASIGVFWSTSGPLNDSATAKICGVVRKGTDVNDLAVNQPPITTIIYYIEAKTVEFIIPKYAVHS